VWTRRETIVGGALVFVWGSALSGECEAQSRRHDAALGCTLPSDEVEQFFSTATEARLYVSGDEPMIPKSGDKDFDYALAQTLAKISQVFDVMPGFAYYDDYDRRNAYATRRIRLNRADGTVLLGQRLLKRLMAGSDHPDVGVAAVCAHEFGHILQYKHGLDRKVKAGQETVRRVELQADFFAGYFAGRRKLEHPSFPAAVFAMTQYNMGDDMIHHPNHHGTPDERAAAIVRGFEVALREQRSLAESIEISVAYVMAL
jgi:putative neutral zinc metallopeptidase